LERDRIPNPACFWIETVDFAAFAGDWKTFARIASHGWGILF
jgi:hypothetical protein